MPLGLGTLALTVALQIGGPAPMEQPGYPALSNAYNQYGFEGSSETRYPVDSQSAWVHGYFQEIPAYGGHSFYRPYNYKDVLSQSQTAAGWGLPAGLPYSQQFWHRYQDQAAMMKLSQVPTQSPAFYSQAPRFNQSAVLPTAGLQRQSFGRPTVWSQPAPVMQQQPVYQQPAVQQTMVPQQQPVGGYYVDPNEGYAPVGSDVSNGVYYPTGNEAAVGPALPAANGNTPVLVGPSLPVIQQQSFRR